MTSRERVLAAINHQEPDRVPVDFGATPSSGISAVAYSNLSQHLGLNDPIRIYDVVQQLAEPSDSVLEHFNADVIDIGRAFTTNPDDWYDITLQNGRPAQYPKWFRPVLKEDKAWYVADKTGQEIAKMPAFATFFDQIYYPYLNDYPNNFKELPAAMEKSMWAAFPPSPWDKADQDDFWPELRKKALFLKENTDKSLLIGAGCNLFEWGTFLRRMDNFLMDLILQPDKVEELLDALMEVHLQSLEKICHWVGDIVDFVKFGDDLGTQNGPFMDPAIYRTLFKPRHTQLCTYAKQNSSMHTYLHSCGSIYQVIPDLIEAGFEEPTPKIWNLSA